MLCALISDPSDSHDISEPADAADPIANADATEPTEPMLKAEPTEPMLSTDPVEAIDKIDPSEARDHLEADIDHSILSYGALRPADAPGWHVATRCALDPRVRATSRRQVARRMLP